MKNRSTNRQSHNLRYTEVGVSLSLLTTEPNKAKEQEQEYMHNCFLQPSHLRTASASEFQCPLLHERKMEPNN
jgi:hypothetical protein